MRYKVEVEEVRRCCHTLIVDADSEAEARSIAEDEAFAHEGYGSKPSYEYEALNTWALEEVER